LSLGLGRLGLGCRLVIVTAIALFIIFLFIVIKWFLQVGEFSQVGFKVINTIYTALDMRDGILHTLHSAFGRVEDIGNQI